ncbi:MAG: NADH-quinone oxidoreductase subunit NuoF [Candidatus Sumerlaeota bacterium]|nr:NADH-quinone oxidoreductase subunit NuoF [Candidatus Sumerlaeota bacterium]
MLSKNGHSKANEAPVVKTQRVIAVCLGPTCSKNGARELFANLKREIVRADLQESVEVVETGCRGLCARGPVAHIYPDNVTYCRLTPNDATRIVQGHLVAGHPLVDKVSHAYRIANRCFSLFGDARFFGKQLRLTLRNCGVIDPESIDEYLAVRGYEALAKVVTEMTPDQVVQQMKISGLRGRGGGGFPTGLKWEITARQPPNPKYVICNADEGDPGAFMDRSAIEGDPHTILEGMAIGGYAMGSNQGFIYIRAEYPLAVKRLEIALEQAKARNLIGKNILGSGFDFDIEIRLGAGAFVCGEETALIHSIEGRRGMPRPRPPFPAQKGLWGQPTCINNVETWANVPVIILDGAEWFASIGTERSKGTKVFAVAGKVKNTGLVEVPMGMTLREIVYDVAGGVEKNKQLKAIQTGGPSGGVIPAQYLDTPVDYESLKAIGSIMGSGGMIVMDETTCMVDVAKFFLEFTKDESCGKCTPCREGTTRMYEILERITQGKGTEEDLDLLEELGDTVKSASLCGLGQTAPNPILSTLRHFRDEYLSHVRDKKCPAGVCSQLVTYNILDNCIGCGACARKCPVSCISGEARKKHLIDQKRCIKCGECFATCKFNAVGRE